MLMTVAAPAVTAKSPLDESELGAVASSWVQFTATAAKAAASTRRAARRDEAIRLTVEFELSVKQADGAYCSRMICPADGTPFRLRTNSR